MALAAVLFLVGIPDVLGMGIGGQCHDRPALFCLDLVLEKEMAEMSVEETSS